MTDYVEITTLSHFKLKYVMPAKDFEALGFTEPVDSEALMKMINAGAVKEFSQLHLGEVLADVQEHNEEDMLTLFDMDNDYLKNWSREQKIKYMTNWRDGASEPI